MGTWAGMSTKSGQPGHHVPPSSSAPGTTAAVSRITPR